MPWIDSVNDRVSMRRVIQFLSMNDLLPIAQRISGSDLPAHTFTVLSAVAVQPQLQLASKPYFETTVYDFAAKLLNLIVNHQADLPDKSRLGWAVTAVFLEVNGFSVSHASVEEVYDLVTKVRSNTLWLHEIARELRAIAESPKNKRM